MTDKFGRPSRDPLQPPSAAQVLTLERPAPLVSIAGAPELSVPADVPLQLDGSAELPSCFEAALKAAAPAAPPAAWAGADEGTETETPLSAASFVDGISLRYRWNVRGVSAVPSWERESPFSDAMVQRDVASPESLIRSSLGRPEAYHSYTNATTAAGFSFSFGAATGNDEGGGGVGDAPDGWAQIAKDARVTAPPAEFAEGRSRV